MDQNGHQAEVFFALSTGKRHKNCATPAPKAHKCAEEKKKIHCRGFQTKESGTRDCVIVEKVDVVHYSSWGLGERNQNPFTTQRVYLDCLFFLVGFQDPNPRPTRHKTTEKAVQDGAVKEEEIEF